MQCALTNVVIISVIHVILKLVSGAYIIHIYIFFISNYIAYDMYIATLPFDLRFSVGYVLWICNSVFRVNS